MDTPPVQAASEMGRRERRKRAMRNRLLEVARERFAAQGVEATRVQEICERVDIAEKTFFNYFPSKRHLMRELANEGVGELIQDIETVRKQTTSTAERIRLFFDQVVENMEQAGPMQREVLTEMVHVAHEGGAEHDQARRLHEGFSRLIANGLEEGDLTEAHPPETLTDMLMGAFYVLMFNWANLDGYPLRDNAQAAARFLADSLTR